MKRACNHCGRTIRSNSRKAVYLFLQDTPKGTVERWVCDKRCYNDYNDGPDIGEPNEDPVRDAGHTQGTAAR